MSRCAKLNEGECMLYLDNPQAHYKNINGACLEYIQQCLKCIEDHPALLMWYEYDSDNNIFRRRKDYPGNNNRSYFAGGNGFNGNYFNNTGTQSHVRLTRPGTPIVANGDYNHNLNIRYDAFGNIHPDDLSKLTNFRNNNFNNNFNNNGRPFSPDTLNAIQDRANFNTRNVFNNNNAFDTYRNVFNNPTRLNNNVFNNGSNLGYRYKLDEWVPSRYPVPVSTQSNRLPSRDGSTNFISPETLYGAVPKLHY